MATPDCRFKFGFIVAETTAGVGVRTFFAMDDVSLIAFTTDDIPANDNFANATQLITTTNISVLVTNVVAGKEPGEPKHAGNSGGHSVWWRWVAPANGAVVINTSGSAFNTLLAVYTGTVVSNLTLVASNDDALGNGLSQVKFNATAGQEYRIALDGKNNASGVAQLNLSFSLDTKLPTVVITSPKNNTKVTEPSVNLKGTATDNIGISSVEYRLENAAGTNDFQDVTGTKSWTATVTGLIPGPNTIRVRALIRAITNRRTPPSPWSVSWWSVPCRSR